MPRVALGIEYDGSAFSGWQAQKHGRGVQSAVEQALGAVAAEPVTVTSAGRTDAGVHALGQVVHFDTVASRSGRSWVLGANTHLPADANAVWAREVDPDFHARFSATARSYLYLVLNRPVRSSLWRRRAWWVHRPLDLERMRAGARRLIGEHDFSAFRAAGCQAKSAVREIRRLELASSEELVSVSVTANAFLHHMVRNLVGVLVRIGTGEEEPGWAQDVLESRDRREAAMTAPAEGLYLVAVEYPSRFRLPATGRAPELANSFMMPAPGIRLRRT